MKKKFVAFGLICLLSAFSASAKLFDINEYTLSNGALKEKCHERAGKRCI